MSYRNDVTQELRALKREASHVLTTGTRCGSPRVRDDGARFAADRARKRDHSRVAAADSTGDPAPAQAPERNGRAKLRRLS
jgi:hypothetical protein